MPGVMPMSHQRIAASGALSIGCARPRLVRSPMTCVREPGGFGLGQVPSRLQARRARTMVCGFCSTGCGARRPPARRRGGQPHARDRLPGQPRHGLPEGVGGADAARRRRSRDRRRCCATPTAGCGRSTGTTAMTTMVARFKAIQARARRRVGRLPEHRPDRHRGDGAARRARQVRHGDGPRRRQHPPVHGHGGRRLQAGVRLRRAALHLRTTSRSPTCIVLVGSNLCIAHPIMWERVMRNRAQPEIIVVDPRRTETAMAATQHLPLAPEVRPGPALRPGQPADRATAGSTATSSTRTRRGFDEFAGVRRPLHAERRRPRRPACRATQLDDAGRHDPRAASASRSGGRWASTRATRACAPRRRSSTWR